MRALRDGCSILLCLLLASAIAGCSNGAAYPNRSVVVICPWAAGGGTDRVARFLADQLQRELGQPVIVQNQTGGSGATGHAAGARARPDGYTLTMGTFELSTMRSMGISDLTYRDFDPLGQVNADPAALIVRAEAPWQSLREFLDDVRQRPGVLKMSGTAAGGAWDLARSGLLLAASLPVDAVLWVPSQGAAPSLVELLGGHIDVVCCSVAEARSQLEAGQLRPLCVMAAERLPGYPDVPTAIENGVDWQAVGWRGLFLPKGTPDDVQQRLQNAVQQIIDSAECDEFMSANGFGKRFRDGDAFTSFLDEQEQRWAKVIDAAGMAATDGKPRVVVTSDPGPWMFPTILSVCIVVGAVLIAGRQLWRRQPHSNAAAWLRFWTDRGKCDVVLLMLLLTAYLLALPRLGFLAATFVVATVIMVRLGTKWLTATALSAAMLMGVYLLFVLQFRVVLPASPWWGF